jgi:uncharacterized membrane protein YeiH
MNPDLLLALDITGTIVFALSGALLAVRKDLDIVGVVVLSVAAGLGGGMVRDLLLGATPPVALENELLLILAMGAGIIGFFFHPRIGRLNQSIRLLDALGLGVFAVVGSLKTLEAGLGPVPAVLLGVVSGVGGGVIRDLLGGEIPLVLRRDVYALAAMAGAVACVGIVEAGLATGVATVVGIASTLALRVLAIWFGWQAPRPGNLPAPPDRS